MALSPQITNLMIILFMMQASKKIPFEDPNVLTGVRILYVVSNLVIAGIYLYTQMQIDKKNDKTVLKYTEPAPMGSTEEPKQIESTVHEYDIQQLRGMFKTQLMGVAMMAFMHLYLKYTNPLLVQSIIPLKGAFESNLVKIHVFGQPASGELKRPFKAAGSGLLGALAGQTAVAHEADTKDDEKKDAKVADKIEASSSSATAKDGVKEE